VECLSIQSCEVQLIRKQKFSSCHLNQEPGYDILVHEDAQFQLHGKFGSFHTVVLLSLISITALHFRILVLKLL